MSYHGVYGPVGYIYNADQYCEECIVKIIRKRYRLHHSSGIAPRGCNCTECVLERIARHLELDYLDERSYDSGAFPKSIPYHNDLHAECGPQHYGYGPDDPEWDMPYCGACCGQCHEVIDGTSTFTNGQYSNECPVYVNKEMYA